MTLIIKFIAFVLLTTVAAGTTGFTFTLWNVLKEMHQNSRLCTAK